MLDNALSFWSEEVFEGASIHYKPRMNVCVHTVKKGMHTWSAESSSSYSPTVG
jgi:hypothetical protein